MKDDTMHPTETTHIVIDGVNHEVDRWEEHPDGPRHTHRAWLHCGWTVDVDHGGARHAAAAGAMRDLADQKRAGHPAERHHADFHEAKASELEATADAHRRMNTARFKVGVATGCPGCLAHEGARIPRAHTAPTTTLADVKTGLPCPQCGSDLHVRRATGKVACAAQGHEYEVPEVLAAAVDLLRRLASGKLEG